MLNLADQARYVADSPVIFKRGIRVYENGSFALVEADPERGIYTYEVDGNYGDYTTKIRLTDGNLEVSCDCPYPGRGCKHVVAAILDLRDRFLQQTQQKSVVDRDSLQEPYLTAEEIKQQAIEDRKLRARIENFRLIEGDMLKGEHLVETPQGKQYIVTVHDPKQGLGHCTCPDYLTNRLGTCKHMIFVMNHLKKKKNFAEQVNQEWFPFLDIYWDSVDNWPRLFSELPMDRMDGIRNALAEYFDDNGRFKAQDLSALLSLLPKLYGYKEIRIQDAVLNRLDHFLLEKELEDMARKEFPSSIPLRTALYPYQEDGIRFSVFKRAALIGDEMGLGKTLQAIAVALLKKQIFGFTKTLVVTLASLKEQWKREIERFTAESAAIVAGSPRRRHAIYMQDESFFKITNYEAVLRDVTILSRFKPDLVILDEAQRIKNFATKTAEAVKAIPKKHGLVLTGTPLENKLEDVYSIVQFLDPYLLAPLWQFAADHFMLSRQKKGKILGYRNLDKLREKLSPIVIRRRKEEVLSDLPEEVVNNYYIELHHKQKKIHNGYLQQLLPLLNKKYLTPLDIRRMQEILLKMRMVCDSTYLIDRKTNLSPKLAELAGIIEEMVLQNERKTVIFSEWTTMTYLIGRHLSHAAIPFVELSGKVPVKKRQALIDEFTNNPECRVFLSTDAGGTGLNLQAADCVINFELPWNPARLNQRVGRVSRIGQKSRCINVINLIAKDSIEEKILAGIQLKTDLFKGVFEAGPEAVEFSHEKRTEILNRLREMMGAEPLPDSSEPAPSEELAEDTPYYLNPKVLRESEPHIDVGAEEQAFDSDASSPGSGESVGGDNSGTVKSGSRVPEQSPEKIEEILDSGMRFLGGLLEMATGKSLEMPSGQDRIVSVDRETGEVTLKFKLRGF